MKRNILLILGFAIALVLSVAVLGLLKGMFSRSYFVSPPHRTITAPSSPRDITFQVEARTVKLVNGRAELEVAPGSASKEVFQIFGEPVFGDLDADGDTDAAFYLTQETGGSGTFFYVVVGVKDKGIYKGTNAMFLGDRISPQNINIMEGKAVANFAERKAGESFAVQPSVGKSVWIHLDPKTFTIGEVVQNFEGEASAAQMTLPMKVWVFVRAEAGGKFLEPKKADAFTLTFSKDGNVAIKTDCNNMGGTYTAQGTTLTFGPLMSTLMYCEGSQESEFSAIMSGVSSYAFTGKGELQLHYGTNGVATFR